MIYLTVADAYSGVLSSQVLDVARRLREIQKTRVKVVICISLRGFLSQRQRILKDYPEAWVLPMYPGIHNWRFNLPMLIITSWLLREKSFLCRGIAATKLGLAMRKMGVVKKVGFDARGAYAAEWSEYQVVENQALIQSAFDMEKYCVQESDFRLAVSQKLVEHWQTSFEYTKSDHVVIPCTLNKEFEQDLPTEETLQSLRNTHGYDESHIIFVYSGSSAGWQSAQLLDEMATEALLTLPNARLLLMAKMDLTKMKAHQLFPDRVKTLWVQHDQVYSVLAMCDYGLLIREPSVTNQVASPTKYAEYLAAGLRIVISPGIGDYSEETLIQNWGDVWEKGRSPEWKKGTPAHKENIHLQALRFFSKRMYTEDYLKLLEGLTV